MKKLFIFLLLLIIFIINVYADERVEVKFKKCVDGDTAKVVMKKKTITVRFLAIDTPETSHPTKKEEPYGKEAKKFTCEYLKKAKKVELEFDKNSDKKDKYDRYLAWVFVDNYLLQSLIVENGFAEVTYLYGDYKYTPILQDKENLAKINKKGIYSDVDNSEYTLSKDFSLKSIINRLRASVYETLLEILDEII